MTARRSPSRPGRADHARRGPRGRRAGLLALAVGASLAGCAHSGEIEPAPMPRRPKPAKVEAAAKRAVRQDCRPTDPNTLPAALSYKERSIIEAENLANEGVALLLESQDAKLPKIEREERFTESVDRMLKALKADPYNVHATYNLAAAYARIGRDQCAINLLARLVELRRRPSQVPAVDEHLDRLLGRGKYRGKLDPDFYDLRDDTRFRDVVKNF